MFTRHFTLISAAAGALLFAGTACQTDVPAPEDPAAQEWTGSIKEAYPGWQPTRQAPEGNESYEAMFDAPKEGVLTPEKKNKPAETAAEIAKPVPAAARIDIAADGALSLDGGVFLKPALGPYLKKIAKSHGNASMVILHPAAGAPAREVNEVLDLCRDSGIASVSLVEDKTASGGSKKVKAGKAKVRVTVDTSKPAQTYKVKSGDTLSSISLKFYKNAAYWNFIYRANKGILSNPNKLAPKMKLSIPALKITKGAL